MLRRSVLLLAAGGVGGAWFVSRDDETGLRESVSETLGTAAGAVDSGTPEPVTFPSKQSLADPFKHIEYHEDGTAELAFVEFHEVDGWMLRYHEYDDLENGLHICQAPEGQTVSINLVELLQRQNREYPDRTFELVALIGAFDSCSYANPINTITDIHSTETIRLPSQYTIASTPTPTTTPESTPTPDENTTVGYD